MPEPLSEKIIQGEFEEGDAVALKAKDNNEVINHNQGLLSPP